MPGGDSVRPRGTAVPASRVPVSMRAGVCAAARWWVRGLFALAGLCLLAFAVLAAHRGDCVGDPGSESYRACRAAAPTADTWAAFTAGTALIAVSLGVVVKVTGDG